jgi:ankyrin repeat protein
MFTPLHAAARNEHAAVVAALLAHGADVNTRRRTIAGAAAGRYFGQRSARAMLP